MTERYGKEKAHGNVLYSFRLSIFFLSSSLPFFSSIPQKDLPSPLSLFPTLRRASCCCWRVRDIFSAALVQNEDGYIRSKRERAHEQHPTYLLGRKANGNGERKRKEKKGTDDRIICE